MTPAVDIIDEHILSTESFCAFLPKKTKVMPLYNYKFNRYFTFVFYGTIKMEHFSFTEICHLSNSIDSAMYRNN